MTKLTTLLTFLLCLMVFVSCKEDAGLAPGKELSFRLLNAAEGSGCVVAVFTRTRESRGMRPVDFNQLEQLPRVLTHRIIPIVESWESEICYTADGRRAMVKRRLEGQSSDNSNLVGYAPSRYDEIRINQNGDVERFSRGELVNMNYVDATIDTSTIDLFRDYRRLPKDSFLLGMRMLRDSLAGMPEFSDLEFSINDDAVSIFCGTAEVQSLQIIDAVTQIPRVMYNGDPLTGEYTRTMIDAELVEGEKYPKMKRRETRNYMSPESTEGVAMYTFEDVMFEEYTVTEN